MTSQNQSPPLLLALLMMPQVLRVMVILMSEEMTKEEAVELAKEEAEQQAEEQGERERGGNSVRKYHSQKWSPPFPQVIPQVPRVMVNLMWPVLCANYQNQKIVRAQNGCSVIILVVASGIMFPALILMHHILGSATWLCPDHEM